MQPEEGGWLHSNPGTHWEHQAGVAVGPEAALQRWACEHPALQDRLARFGHLLLQQSKRSRAKTTTGSRNDRPVEGDGRLQAMN